MERDERARRKAEQIRCWDTVAAGWARQAGSFERAGRAITETLLDRAGVRAGSRVLDLASGTGEPALSAARRVGKGGSVLATDQSPRMIEALRRRAGREGLAGIETLVADMETLELPGRSFDSVICRFGLMFLDDLRATLKRIVTLLAPGGRFAASVWPEAERVACIDLPRRVAMDVFDLPECGEEEPGPFRLSDAAELSSELERAGLSEVELDRVPSTMEFSSFAAYRTFLEETSSSLPELLASHPPEKGEELWSRLETAVRTHTDREGSLRLPGEAILVSGRRPWEG